MENVSLKQYTKALFGDLFDNKAITEIVINRENEIFYEDSNGFHIGTAEECARVTKNNLEKFANAVATFCSQKLSESNPILGTTLPSDERIQIVIPPVG